MPISGCTNPNAANYNPQAVTDDGSCYYVNKVAGTCYAFEDASDLIDHSFTMSWSVIENNWVFYHDYIPDFYFATREQLYNLKNGQIYQHHDGPPGVYHGNVVPASFFLDVVFHGDTDRGKQIEQTLNTINWITEVLNLDGSVAPFDTLTHITIWNSYQCSGRISLSQVFVDLEQEVRKTQGRWSFNDFRNLLATQGVSFLADIFGNFAVLPGVIDLELPWYEKQLIEDNYFIVRFEFDNTTGKKIYLNDADIDADPSYR